MKDLRLRQRWRTLGPTAQALSVLLVGLAAVGPILPIALLVLILLLLIYAAWAYSINFITGMTGYVSFGHVVFVGAGSYALGYGVSAWGIDPLLGVVLGGIGGATLAAAIGVVALRLRGVYFAIASLVTPLAAVHIVSATPVLGDGSGIILNLGFRPLVQFYAVWVILGLEIGLTWWLTRGRIGFGIRALRDDEDAARAVGIDAPRLKLVLYTASGLFAGAAGAILAWNVSGVFPNASFDLGFSLLMLAMIVVGGMGTLSGPMLGAVVVFIPYIELLTTLPQGTGLVVGLLVVLVALVIPGGIVGTIRRLVPASRSYLE